MPPLPVALPRSLDIILAQTQPDGTPTAGHDELGATAKSAVNAKFYLEQTVPQSRLAFGLRPSVAC